MGRYYDKQTGLTRQQQIEQAETYRVYYEPEIRRAENGNIVVASAQEILIVDEAEKVIGLGRDDR
jgi:hypothetical protein